MSHPTTADRSGSGPTQQGSSNAAGAGVDAAVGGAALLLALYGAVVVLGDLLFHSELTPHSGFAVAGIMLGLLLVGAVLGGFLGSMADRD